MAKKVMVLNGSPRRKGNTSMLVDAFSRGARETGCEVEEFFLEKMDIKACKGCFGGDYERECPCVQRDDMMGVYEAFRSADVLVLASPLYWWTISGQLKVAVDRLFAAVENPRGELAVPQMECALLMAAEGDGFEESVFWYEHLMERVGWTDLGRVLCSGVAAAGDIAGRPELDAAYDLGRSLS